MVEGFSKVYSVVPFTGIPQQDKASNRSYTKSLRLAAAKAGAGTIVAYWGVLEAAQENAATKTVSWVPLVGWMVPDESQNMRIRLKVFVIDVATGRWEIVIPRVYNDEKYSSTVLREESDQKQVTKLKELAYRATVDEIVKLYSQ